MSPVASGMDYSGVQEKRKQLLKILNAEKTKFFDQIPKSFEDIAHKQSAVNAFNIPPRRYVQSAANFNNNYHESIYSGLSDMKMQRLRELRQVGDAAEMKIALRKIADEFVTENREGQVAKVFVKNQPDEVVDIIRTEFYDFIELFKFKEKGWNYCLEFLIDGEKFFENLISIETPELGIVGIAEIPPERIDPFYANVQNEEICHFKLNINPTFGYNAGHGYSVTNPVGTSNYIELNRDQITYIHSGEWCPQRRTRKSHISNALRDFRINYMMEDTNLIYITSRAPERLWFQIPVDNMPDDMAEEHMRRQAAEFNQQQNVTAGGVSSYHNPQSQLENYYTATVNGQGVQISTIGGNVALEGRLELIKYFASKLYQALQIPTSRLNPDTQKTDGTTITAEEVEFGKMIERMQKQFATAIKRSFVAHLKLKGKNVRRLRDYLDDKYDKECKKKFRFNNQKNYPIKLRSEINLSNYYQETEKLEKDIDRYCQLLQEQVNQHYANQELILENCECDDNDENLQALNQIKNQICDLEKKLAEIQCNKKSLWQQYELDETDIEVVFNVPNAYNALQKQQRLQIKIDTINSLMNLPFMSLAYALKYADRFDGGPMTNSELNELYAYAVAEAKLKGKVAGLEEGELLAAGNGGGFNPLGGGLDDLGGGGSPLVGAEGIAPDDTGEISPPVLSPPEDLAAPEAGGEEDTGGGGEPTGVATPPPLP